MPQQPEDWTDAIPMWDEFVANVRRDAIKKIDESAVVMQLWHKGGFDVKFAVEIGAAILMNKPIIMVVAPGAEEIPPKLKAIADKIVYTDVDLENGRTEIANAIKELVGVDE